MSTEASPPLVTEQRHPATANIDALRTPDMLRLINDADQAVAGAVRAEIPQIALAVDAIAERLRHQGRLFYLGAGTSGRLGVLDASECPPTFHTPPEMVQAYIAGGDRALRTSVERAEDDASAGAHELARHEFGARDVLVGIAASGRTPYVLGALRFARATKAFTVGLSCTLPSAVADEAEIAITPIPGPEVITGSTRMRAGTATKLVLNMISTGVMIRLGYVYGNLMVNVQPTNAKLADRARRIVAEITGISPDEASRLLDAAGGSVRVAVLMHLKLLSRVDAEHHLTEAKGSLREALTVRSHNG